MWWQIHFAILALLCMYFMYNSNLFQITTFSNNLLFFPTYLRVFRWCYQSHFFLMCMILRLCHNTLNSHYSRLESMFLFFPWILPFIFFFSSPSNYSTDHLNISKYMNPISNLEDHFFLIKEWLLFMSPLMIRIKKSDFHNSKISTIFHIDKFSIMTTF